MAERPNYKARAAIAVKHLRRAMDVANRDHNREDGIIWFDFGSLEQCVKFALEALEPTEQAEESKR